MKKITPIICGLALAFVVFGAWPLVSAWNANKTTVDGSDTFMFSDMSEAIGSRDGFLTFTNLLIWFQDNLTFTVNTDDQTADEVDDTSTTNKFATQAELDKLAGIEDGATAGGSLPELTNTLVTTGTDTVMRSVSAAMLKLAAETFGAGATVTGNESAFDGWDKDSTDDFTPTSLLADYSFNSTLYALKSEAAPISAWVDGFMNLDEAAWKTYVGALGSSLVLDVDYPAYTHFANQTAFEAEFFMLPSGAQGALATVTYSNETCTPNQLYVNPDGNIVKCTTSGDLDLVATILDWTVLAAIAPVLTEATVTTDGTLLTLTSAESLTVGTIVANVDCTTAGTDITVSGAPSPGTSVAFTLGTAVESDDTCNMDYTSGITATDDSEALVALVDYSVDVSGSTYTPVSGNIDTFDGATTQLALHDSNWKAANGTVDNLDIDGSGSVAADWQYGVGATYYDGSGDLSKIVVAANTTTASAYQACVRMDGTTNGYCLTLDANDGTNFPDITIKKGATILCYLTGTWPVNAPHTLQISASGTATTSLTASVDGLDVGVCDSGTKEDSTGPITTGFSGFVITASATYANDKLNSWQDYE